MGQTLSSTNFFFYGRKHFTAKGYAKHVKAYYNEPVAASATAKVPNVDLTGKVVVVTGANSGLGKEVSTYAAARGATVYMLCRSPDRAAKAQAEIVAATGNDKVHVIKVDVSELAHIRRAAAELQSKESKIHALVCNAGVILKERKVSAGEGYEQTFASHLLGGSYLLSKLLLPQVRAADGEGRIVITTSGGMYNFKLPAWPVLTSTDEKLKFDGTNAYAYAKRGQVLLAERWSQEHTDIKIVTAHPGWSETPAVDEAFGDAKKYLQPLRSPWEGAEGISWLVGTAASKIQSGALYLDRKVQPKHVAGPFYSEGSYTKNTKAEVDAFMAKLKEAAGI